MDDRGSRAEGTISRVGLWLAFRGRTLEVWIAILVAFAALAWLVSRLS